MIGIYGLLRAQAEAPADVGPLATRVPNRYATEAVGRTGAALGRTSHDPTRGGGIASSADGAWQAVVCGEIFNSEAFGDLGVDIDNPAAIVMELLRGGAIDRLADVNGQYCAASYDRLHHRLILITDRLATHPIHYWHNRGEVVFATQLHTLIGDARVPRRADPAAVAQLFTMQRTVGRTTPLAAVTALPAATVWQMDREGIGEHAYWELAWRRPDFSIAEGAKLFAATLPRVVDRQRHPNTVGLLLSGGLDSRMILGAARDAAPSCWTTASFEDNPELAIARRVAAARGAEHNTVVVAPKDTLDILPDTVIASGGLYPASTPISAFMPQVGAKCHFALSGHGIDYTLRGYYLPARFLELAGSRTRLPVLRSIRRQVRGADVLANLRQGPPRETIDRIVRSDRREEWWRGQADALQQTLAPWLQSDEPYNAWDGFILHAVNKHYAFSGMMAVRAEVDLRLPAFDNELFDIYLRMPPDWRCNGRMIQTAMKYMAPDLSRIANANTGFRASLDPWLEVAGLLGRGTLRRFGMLSRAAAPTESHSLGSWQNLGGLYREDGGHRRRFKEIQGRLDGLAMGVMDADGLSACIDEHLGGVRSHTKLLRQLLTHDAWVSAFDVAGHA